MQPLTREVRSRLEDDLDRGTSLPASWYTDPAMLVLERDRIFRRTWQYVGRTDQLGRRGDYVTGDAGGVPVVVVRGDERLQGFVNVCRHRRHLVMTGTGNRKLLQCPYHAWSYDLTGCLQSAPRTDREPGFNRADLSLLPVLVDTWGSFVFVNVDLSAPPLANFLGELPALLARSGLDLAKLQFHQREEWQTPANWKVLIENYLECYHCPVAHPGFSSIIDTDPDAYVLQPYEWFFAQFAPTRASARDGTDQGAAYDVRNVVVQAQYYYLWPNFTLSTNPGLPNLIVHLWLPDGPEHTRGFTERFYGPDVPEEFVHASTAFSRQVGTEDHALTSSVQSGLRSGLPEQGRLLPKSEQLVLRFQKLILQALTGEE